MDIDNAAHTQQVMPNRRARLRAIVAVDQEDRVRCQAPGCGHSVYAAVHVVEEEGRLLVLGSTCYAKRYGSAAALGTAQYGAGSGRKLTDEEREMLLQNTAALLARFEAETAAAAQAQAARMEELRRKQSAPLIKSGPPPPAYEPPRSGPSPRGGPPGLSPQRASPWPWQMPRTSIALFTAPQGEQWVRVQHQDGSQKLVPWPRFPGWETALPPGVGVADASLGAIAVDNIVEAIRTLQRSGFRGPVVGVWQELLSGRRTP